MIRRLFSRNDLLLLAIVVVWAVNLSVIKIALFEIPYLPFNAMRLLVAALFLVAALLISGENLIFERSDWWRVVMLSILGIAVYQFLFMKGIALTTASNTGLIFGSAPIFITLLSSYFKHEELSWINWGGVLLGFAGLYLVVAARGGIELNSAYFRGDLILLAAVLLWAHYSVSARPLLKRYSPLKFSTFTMLLGSLIFFFFNFRTTVSFPWRSVSLKSWLCLIFSGVLALSLALIFWFRSVKLVGNSRTAVYSNLQPVLALVFAALILGETLFWNLFLGMFIIIAGIVLTKIKR